MDCFKNKCICGKDSRGFPNKRNKRGFCQEPSFENKNQCFSTDASESTCKSIYI